MDGLCKTVVVGDSTAHVALIILDVEVMAAILIVACGSIDARQLTTDIFVVSAIFIWSETGRNPTKIWDWTRLPAISLPIQ